MPYIRDLTVLETMFQISSSMNPCNLWSFSAEQRYKIVIHTDAAWKNQMHKGLIMSNFSQWLTAKKTKHKSLPLHL